MGRKKVYPQVDEMNYAKNRKIREFFSKIKFLEEYINEKGQKLVESTELKAKLELELESHK